MYLDGDASEDDVGDSEDDSDDDGDDTDGWG